MRQTLIYSDISLFHVPLAQGERPPHRRQRRGGNLLFALA